MARLLVKDQNQTHPDPEIDKRAAYKRDDIVAVVPDSHIWGESEWPPLFNYVMQYRVGSKVRKTDGKHYLLTPLGWVEFQPKFRVEELPGVPVEEVRYLMGEERQALNEVTSLAVRKSPRLSRAISRQKERGIKTRRRYSINSVTKQITDKTRQPHAS